MSVVWLSNVDGMVWAKVGDEGRLKPTGVYWNLSMQVSVQYTDGEITLNFVDAHSGAWAVKVGEYDE
jgi:hypothetical protein